MFFFRSGITNILFYSWVRISQLVGLVLVNFDEKKDCFVNMKFSAAYCVVFACLLSMAYPISIIKFYEAMFQGNIQSTFSIADFVSTFECILLYCFMILSYHQQFIYRNEMRDTLNRNLNFFRALRESCREFELENVFNYKRKFFFSLLVKICMVLTNLMTLYYLVEGKPFYWYYALQFFPNFVACISCLQYLLGVLIIR